MTQRINFAQRSPDLFKKFLAFTNALGKSSIEEGILHLVSIRISQLNGCDFCLDMHVKQAAIYGENEQRLDQIAGWRESALFTPRERAALTWTDILTRLPDQGVPDEVYDRVREELSEQEIADLSFLIVSVNGWDRINIGFKTESGRSTRNEASTWPM
ncbi:carboxymuconolactone decarboxylase family protein [Paenibacillus sacheonensis]|uniref:Carboxymuconolactone decarboxylase family protein n=1 Tax=Paenibacillus sacheonensis TaxID=742054 RepID=A0A7X5BVR9_9BACL|nr:carboxymuconolactone decarboxylase family protein [Paenibacillus sacheonensis]MBM7566063.1 AhpD family alkylhydroperoxidase [Paenibacillus sacheonensis]NBC68628.1 carboxymuconolactone decarboxylase family protein [Paenibacillus sacheonensis]